MGYTMDDNARMHYVNLLKHQLKHGVEKQTKQATKNARLRARINELENVVPRTKR